MRLSVWAFFLLSVVSITEAAQGVAPGIKETQLDYESLRIEFDQPMQTWAGKVQLDNIKITPAVDCEWSWDDDTAIECNTRSRPRQFQKASHYRVEFGKGFLSQEGFELLPTSLVLATDGPEIEARIKEWKNAVPVILLVADQTVTAEAIQQVVSPSLNSSPLAYRLQKVENEDDYHKDHVSYEMQFETAGVVDGLLKIQIKPGLQSTHGPVRGKQDRQLLHAIVNEAFNLRTIACRNKGQYLSAKPPADKPGAMRCDAQTIYVLNFSREISKASLEKIRSALPAGWSIDPPEPDQYRYYGYYHNYDSKLPKVAPNYELQLKTEKAATQYLLEFPFDLTSTDGKVLNQTHPVLFDIGDYAPSVEAKPSVIVQLPGGKALPVVSIVNPQISRMHWNQLGIAERLTEKHSRVKFKITKNKAFIPEMPKPDMRIQENGGLFLASSNEFSHLNYGLAYAPFGVLSYESNGEILVWATQWQNGAAVADAEVEILRLDATRKLHVIGTGKTGSFGTARLQINNKEFLATDLMSLVRVKSNGLIVVSPAFNRSSNRLPFERQPDRYDSYREYDGDESRLVFGVTELPLYRPGETVNYRLWSRQKKANHLLVVDENKKVELQFSDIYEGKTLQSWDANLDSNASVAGQLQLSRLLPDGFYCIARDEIRDRYSRVENGACFQVARFEAQPLWAKLKADRESVLVGQNLNFELDSGYFSGGPAANVELRYSGLNTIRRIEDAYPDFASYTFIDPFKDDEDPDAGSPVRNKVLPKMTDAKGKAKFTLSFKEPLQDADETAVIPFGIMEFSAEVRISGKASAGSNTVAVNYSSFPRFVGLKTKDWWLQQDKDPGLEAVVISHDGKAIAGEAVDISIFKLVKNSEETRVGECKLLAGQISTCSFRASEAGRYLFRATSKNAATTELVRYVGKSYGQDDDSEKPDARLRLLKASDGQTAARVMLEQPYEKATALLTLEYDYILHYWVQKLDSKQTEIDIPVKAEWTPGLSLRVIIRPSVNDPAAAIKMETLDALLDIDIPKPEKAAVKVKLAKSRYKPGEEIELEISNPGKQQRFATLSVLDDSVYQQASSIWEFQDPEAKHWLGVLDSWDLQSWYGLEAWSGERNFFYTGIEVTGSRIRRVDAETAQPVSVITRAEVSGEEGKEIEAVEVTGSRIKAIDSFMRVPVAKLILDRTKNSPGKPMPRVRSQFVDAAYWNPDIVLAPGETKKIKFKLPDNLTQWRVLLWASDNSDDFALTQTTFETALPIEVRAGLPSQLFVGDSSSAQISARNQSDLALAITLRSALDGAGVSVNKTQKARINPYAVLEQELAFAPTKTGDLNVLSIADSVKETDGLSSGTTVQSRFGEEKIPQAGWLDLNQLNLTLPKLPSSAIESKVGLQVSRGFDAWADGWLKDLQDYPHRCWEQTLSRAVGGAYAEAYDKESTWSDRQTTVNDALQVASSFKDEEGYYRYFQNENYDWNREPNFILSAYTLKSFRYLQNLGYRVSGDLVKELEEKLPARLASGTQLGVNGEPNIPWETAATIAGVIEKPEQLDENSLAGLWQNWQKLSWFGRSELLQAMSRKPEFAEQTKEGIQRLREAGVQHGLRQVIGDSRDFSYYMGSDLRDQCAVVSTLFKLDKAEEGRVARERLLRGVYDLYAGGTASLDTQSSAQCLMALHDVSSQNKAGNADAKITVALDAKSQTLDLTADKHEVNWQSPLATTSKTLSLATDNNAGGTMNYSAVISYQYDLQQAEVRAVGLGLQRHYDVLRNGKWAPLSRNRLREGDWVRVRLIVNAPRERHFVAVSDFAPGGLVTRDITLSSVGGADVKNIGGNGSYYFDSRQTGSNVVRIYAEYLPAGRHEIYYYAQAVHPGDYFAPPAIAELMYGRASRANTRADRLVVEAGK